MKFLILIAATCMLAGISGEESGSAETTEPTVESLKQKASDLFSDFTMKQSEVNSDLLYEFIYTKYEAENEKLQRIACKRTSDLIVAKTDALTQLQQSKEYLTQTCSSFAIKLCSITATIDIELYINPEIQNGISTELMYYQSTLSQLQSNSYSLFYDTETYTLYYDTVYAENATVESLQTYINTLESSLSTYKYDMKSKAQQFVYRFSNLVYQFESQGQERTQHYQTILSNVNTEFYSCAYNYYNL